MNTEKLLEYLKKEYNEKFEGWDFSYLKGRMEESALPWNYKHLINKYMPQRESLLDMDTGGGEFLVSLPGLPKKVFATEMYEPNIPIARKRLEEKNIVLKPVKEKGEIPFPDNYFDLIINRHGSYDIREIHRALKMGGVFVTQQVGGLNALDLTMAMSDKPLAVDNWGLINNIHEINKTGLTILESREFFGSYRFYDIGAVVYYLKCIPWQVNDFTVEKHIDKLEIMKKSIDREGYIDFLNHRFYLVMEK